MRKCTLILTLLTVFHFTGNTQVLETGLDQDTQPVAIRKLNYVKLNLTSLAVKNIGLQYERILTRRTSVALSGRFMPGTSLPFKSFLVDKISDGDTETEKILNGLRMSNYAITPEVKFTLGKGYGQGFYISLFYRYSNFDITGFPVEYDSDLGHEKSIDVTGNLKAHTGGVLFGLQKNLGKFMVLDLWLLGPHAGGAKGTLIGFPDSPLTASEQQQVRESLEDIDIPLVDKTVFVDANHASLQLDGPWAGLRMGISLGVRF